MKGRGKPDAPALRVSRGQVCATSGQPAKEPPRSPSQLATPSPGEPSSPPDLELELPPPSPLAGQEDRFLGEVRRGPGGVERSPLPLSLAPGSLPPGSPRSLFPYQEAAVRFAVARSAVALFLEMRLGKSLVVIRALKEAGARRVLVVAPLSVLAAWEQELDLEGETYCKLRGKEAKQTKWQEAGGYFLINYESLRVAKHLALLPWDAVVLDESTRIKNPKAQITKLCLQGFQLCKRKLILSGLPAPEGPLDYVTQLLFLRGKVLGASSYWGFRQALCFPVGYDWVLKKGMLPRLKEEVKQSAFILSRKAAGVGSRKIYEVRKVPMTSRQKELIREVKEEFRLKQEETKWIVTQCVWLARIAGGYLKDETVSENKTHELLSLLKGGELSNQQCVVLFRFVREIIEVGRALRTKGLSVSSIRGLTSPTERKRRTQSFSKGKTQVLLCQIQVAQFGLDFSSADAAIFYSNSFSLESRAQAEDRIVHPKKATPLLYLDLVSENSFDETVLSALREKRAESKILLSDLLHNFAREQRWLKDTR